LERLLIRPQAKHDESLLGYLLRLTEENVFQSILSLVRLGDLDSKNEKSSVNDYIKALVTGDVPLEQLAARTGEMTSALDLKRYPLLEKGIDGSPDFHLFINTQIQASFLRFAYPRFCPECMREDPYHRFYWDYVPLTCCPVHKKLLMDICPKCHKQVTWSRSSLSKCECGFNLFDYEGVDVPEDQLEHVYLTANLIGKADAHSYNTVSRNQLSNLNLPSPMHPDLRRLRSLRDLNEYLVEKIVFQNATTRVKMRDELQWQPNAEVHQKMVMLFTGKKVPLLVDYTGSSKISPKQRARHLGIKHIAYRTPPHQINQNGFIQGSQENDLVNTATAVKILGISDHILKNLMSAEIIQPFSGPDVDGHGDNLFSKNQIDKLFAHLADLATNNSLHEKEISVGKYLKSFDIKRRRPISEIIQAALIGKIAVYSVPGTRLTDLILSMNDIEKYCPVTPSDNGYLSVKEICTELNIYPDAIYRTLETGLLPFTIKGRTKIVHQDDFHLFNRQYVFIKEIATQYKCNATNLADKLIDEGIEPVSGPKIDKNLVYVFRRGDIKDIDLEKIIKKDSYKSRTGRIAKSDYDESHKKLIDDLSLITSTAAAKLLNISSQRLGKLLKSGELSLYEHSTLPKYKKYLERSDVDAYLQRYRNNPDLITYEDAAVQMGETTSRFYSTWVKFKRIEVIDDGIGNKYIPLEKLLELKKFKQNAISIAEAADLRGVDRSYFSNLIKLGKMQPISGPGVDNYKNFFLSRKEVEEHTNENWWG
jgi:hypothetical protein